MVLGVGAALAAGQGVAHADSSEAAASEATQSQPARPHPVSQLKRDVSALAASVASNAAPRSRVASPSAALSTHLDSLTGTTGVNRPRSSFGVAAAKPTSVTEAIDSARTALTRTITGSLTPQAKSTTTATPSPGDVAQTPYGELGKWMLNPDGSVANWGGQTYLGNKTLVEPINVILIDPTSTTPEESTAKLNKDMTKAGFPAQQVHSTGFGGNIDGTVYGQQPSGPLQAFSDNLYVLPNDHARVFGPAPVAQEGGGGYVWTAAASTETPGIYAGALTHRYVSFDLARDILVVRLLLSGGATFVGVVPMNNQYNDGTVSTGDHDGYAVVLQLN